MKKLYLLSFTFVLFLSENLFSQAPVMNPIVGPTAVCAAPSTANTYSASASNSPTSYVWTVAPITGVLIGSPNSANTTISFPNSNASYTVVCYAINGFGVSAPVTLVVNVFQTPNVTFSGSNSFCQGSSTNISASSTLLSASSTISYFWSPGTGLNTTSGPNVVANPTITTTYTVNAFIGFCANSSVLTVTVLPKPTITITGNSSICFGNSTALTASGANTYTWSGGISNGVPFTPSVTGTYSVNAQSVNGCTNTAATTVSVNPNPVVSVSSNSIVICVGLSATLTLGGTAQSYSLNSITSPTTVVVSPTVTTTYTVTGKTSAGCSALAMLTQSVSPCAGIHDPSAPNISTLKGYPNPGAGYFNLRSGKDETVSIINEFGQLIKTVQLSADNEVVITGLASGMYFVISPDTRIKIIVLQ